MGREKLLNELIIFNYIFTDECARYTIVNLPGRFWKNYKDEHEEMQWIIFNIRCTWCEVNCDLAVPNKCPVYHQA